MAHLDYSAGHQTAHRGNAQRLYQTRGKRVLDLVLAFLLLPLLLPLVFALWALVRLDGGPGFFAHTRIGRNGRLFRCWKLRTMCTDAEQRLTAHLAQDPVAAREWQEQQKLSDDPRVTRLGRILRRTSLDEVPQILNVLRGEMSFVGPRPVTVPELDKYGAERGVYLSLRPGITGIWQVNGRMNGCYIERLNMDRSYADRVGFVGDIVLILQTALVVFWPTGR